MVKSSRPKFSIGGRPSTTITFLRLVEYPPSCMSKTLDGPQQALVITTVVTLTIKTKAGSTMVATTGRSGHQSSRQKSLRKLPSSHQSKAQPHHRNSRQSLLPNNRQSKPPTSLHSSPLISQRSNLQRPPLLRLHHQPRYRPSALPSSSCRTALPPSMGATSSAHPRQAVGLAEVAVGGATLHQRRERLLRDPGRQHNTQTRTQGSSRSTLPPTTAEAIQLTRCRRKPSERILTRRKRR
jgi:hypothetical protein